MSVSPSSHRNRLVGLERPTGIGIAARGVRSLRRVLFEPLACLLVLAAVLLPIGGVAGADTLVVNGQGADQAVREDGSKPWGGDPTFRCGRENQGIHGVFVFQLPTLPTGHTVTSANLDFYIEDRSSNAAFNLDLYGLGPRDASTVLATDFYRGAYDGDTTDATAIQDNIVTQSTPVDTVVSTDNTADAALAAYINDCYASGGAGKYIFLRLSPDYSGSPTYQYHIIASANSSSPRPVLTLTTNGGTPPPSGSYPVARWDVVPDQLISSSFKAGVVAFHRNGVKVEFRVNGSLVSTAANPTYNDRTGVWEHWFTLNPANYSDGPLTIDARAIPLSGGSPHYDLPSLTLYANAGGTLGSTVVKWVDAANGNDSNPGTQSQPYKTLVKAIKNTPAGGTINLKAGSYNPHDANAGTNRSYWTTIQPAPGVSRDQVEIIQSGGAAMRPGTNRLRWKNVTLASNKTGGEGASAYILMGVNIQPRHLVWLDDCKAWNKLGQFSAETNVFNMYTSYLTGGVGMNLWNAPGGTLIRNYTVENITSDVWTGTNKLVVNCEAINVNRGGTEAHPDFYQSHTANDTARNSVILYNVSGVDIEAQGIFGHNVKDSAFVNVLFHRAPNLDYKSQLTKVWENVLFFHIDIINQTWLWRDSNFAPENVFVVNSIFESMEEYNGADASDVSMEYNHFIGGATFGTNTTTGSAQFVNYNARNFHLQSGSPARGSGVFLQCVPADINGVPHGTPRNRGAFANP